MPRLSLIHILHPQNFYQINADVDGTQFVTARGWEDLSNLLDVFPDQLLVCLQAQRFALDKADRGRQRQAALQLE